jgi:uncharacterized integral membrane protein
MENEKPEDIIEDIIDLETSTPRTNTDPVDTPAVDGEAEVAAPESQYAPPPVYKGAGVRWGLLGGLILVVLIIVLAAQNTDDVEFAFFALSITAPLSAIILGTAVIAVIIDELAGWIWGIRKRRQLRSKAELKQFKSELEPEKTRRFGRS